MSDGFKVEFPDLPKFSEAFRTAPKTLREQLIVAAQRIASKAANLSRSYAPVWTGEARGSVYSRVEPKGGSISAVWGASSEHAYYADQGRGPGKMPPEGALLGWHGVTEAEEFVIRRAIGRHGTKGKPFVTRAFKEIPGFAFNEFSAAIGRALAKIGGSR
jgi:hypothetical protein